MITSQPHRLVAACMLAALETGTHVDLCEQETIMFLRDQKFIQAEWSAHVEYGCLEHGIVHVCAWNGFSDVWIEIDPAGAQPAFL